MFWVIVFQIVLLVVLVAALGLFAWDDARTRKLRALEEAVAVEEEERSP